MHSVLPNFLIPTSNKNKEKWICRKQDSWIKFGLFPDKNFRESIWLLWFTGKNRMEYWESSKKKFK